MFILKKKKTGNMARNQLKEIENLIYNIQRLIVRNFTDKEIQEDIKLLTYKVENEEKNKPLLSAKYRKEKYHLEQISVMILNQLIKAFFTRRKESGFKSLKPKALISTV